MLALALILLLGDDSGSGSNRSSRIVGHRLKGSSVRAPLLLVDGGGNIHGLPGDVSDSHPRNSALLETVSEAAGNEESTDKGESHSSWSHGMRRHIPCREIIFPRIAQQ